MKLKDERIAFGFGNSEVRIYDIDGGLNEKELTIKINNCSRPISYINQLKNDVFVICTVTDIYFFFLKKYKYEFIKKLQYNENVLKVDQLITKEIIVLFTHSIKILNNNYQEIGEIKINCINFEIISDKIIILGPDNISINKYNSKNELIKIEQFNYYSINSVKNIICLDENTFAVIGQKNILYYKSFMHYKIG